MPIPAAEAVPTKTIEGRSGCTAMFDGVTVSVEANGVVRLFRGKIWINGVETSEEAFPARFEQARVEARIRKGASQLKGVINGAQETGKELLEFMKRR